jgi:hypothetical protein
MASVLATCGYGEGIPKGLHAEWAEAFMDVLVKLEEARDDDERDRALRWQLLLHQILLRKPFGPSGRGGSRAHDVYRQRFAAWRNGEFGKLVRWWARDREASASSRNLRRTPSERGNVDRALALIEVGELSKAARLLTSSGLGDLSDPRIVAQLAAKHPLRATEMDGDLARFGPIEDLVIDLTQTFQRLPRRSGTGPDGLRNGHLTALARPFEGRRAAKVMEHVNRFAARVVNDGMPAWFYWVSTCVRLLALKKPGVVQPADAPDVRPLALGGVFLRAIGRNVAERHKSVFAEQLAPVQIAVGVSSGGQQLVVGTRAIMEMHPEFVIVKIDKENAYNRLRRDVTVERLMAIPGLRPYARFVWTMHAPKSPIVLGDALAPFSSEEGERQGSPLSCGNYALASHHECLILDAELAAHGGGARFQVDDGYAFGPPDVIFGALRRYNANIAACGERLVFHKCVAYCPALDAALALDPAYLADAALGDAIAVGTGGFVVGGVPVGTTAFVADHFDNLITDQLSYIEKIETKLRSVHSQSLWTLALYVAQTRLDYIASLAYPCDSTPMLARFDARILGLVSAAFGAAGPPVVADALARARLRLPVRLKGCGVRAREDVVLAAFAGTMCAVIPTMINRLAGGRIVRGFMPQLAPWLGPGSMDRGVVPRFDTLCRSGCRLGVTFSAAWGALRAEIAAALGAAPDSGPLGVEAACAGTVDGVPIDKVQREITLQREEARVEPMRRALSARGAGSMPAAAFQCCDRFSTRFLLVWPSKLLKITNAEWPEIVATFLGMPSPALVAHVGKPISGTEAVVDAFGVVFFNHSQLLNRDSARSVFHNTMERHFYDSLREAGIFVRREVLDLFTDLMTPAQRADFWRRYPNSRSRHGCIPDILFEDGGVRRLADVKTMGFGETNYGETRLRHVVGPVDERARKVHVEYVRKVKALGRRDVAGDQDRFVQRLLELTGVTVGLVLGYFGEASSAVHQLVGKCAEGIAEANWEEMGAVCRADAVASQKRRLYGEWGIAAQREIARIRLGGLRWLGRGVYYPAGAVHAASDARQDAREHAYERASGPNVHGGGGDAFVGRG